MEQTALKPETVPVVRCDNCGCAFVPEVERQQDGEIEYTYFCCAYCGKAYMVSVSDAALRKDIERYAEIAKKGRQKRLPEKQIRKMRKLLQANIRRSRELLEQYIREDTDGREERSGTAGDEHHPEDS